MTHYPPPPPPKFDPNLTAHVDIDLSLRDRLELLKTGRLSVHLFALVKRAGKNNNSTNTFVCAADRRVLDAHVEVDLVVGSSSHPGEPMTFEMSPDEESDGTAPSPALFTEEQLEFIAGYLYGSNYGPQPQPFGERPAGENYFSFSLKQDWTKGEPATWVPGTLDLLKRVEAAASAGTAFARGASYALRTVSLRELVEQVHERVRRFAGAGEAPAEEPADKPTP